MLVRQFKVMHLVNLISIHFLILFGTDNISNRISVEHTDQYRKCQHFAVAGSLNLTGLLLVYNLAVYVSEKDS